MMRLCSELKYRYRIHELYGIDSYYLQRAIQVENSIQFIRNIKMLQEGFLIKYYSPSNGDFQVF